MGLNPQSGWGANRPRATGAYQTCALVAWSVVTQALIWPLLRVGYPEPRDVPALFLVTQLTVGRCRSARGLPERFGALWSRLVEGEEPPHHQSQLTRYWLMWRSTMYGPILLVLFTLVLVGSTALIVSTGLGISSPFIPPT